MGKTVFDVLREQFNDNIRKCEEFLGGGSSADYAAYKELCGVIRGLKAALREVEDLEKHYKDQENE